MKLVELGEEDGQVEKLVELGEEDGQAVPDRGKTCAGCDDILFGQVCACDACGYYLHESCAYLQKEIEHPFHPCRLSLHLVPKSQGAGGERQGMMPSYRCESCNFEMDVASGRFQSTSSEEEMVLHFSHKHPLKISFAIAYAKSNCNGCERPIFGRIYVCQTCEYYLHETCAKLPRKIQHFFHPCPLFLTKLIPRIICDACANDCNEFVVYHCQKCNFSMDVECAKFQPIRLNDGGDRIQHWSHLHPLTISKANGKENLDCNVCGGGISGETDYATCEHCPFHIHKSCLGLKREIQHRCHPCRLFLKPPQQFDCNVCLVDVRFSCTYQCKKCDFNMDVECALLSQETVQDDQVPHFSHHHPLRLLKDLKRNSMSMLECFVCGIPTSGFTSYGCKQCDVYLHKTCLDILPQIISTGDNSSILTRSSRGNCNGCGSFTSSFFFREATFNKKRYRCWCIPCALEKTLSIRVSPSEVETRLHFHPCSLTLKLHSTFICNACFTHCHTHVYYCGYCDFYVGIKCAQISKRRSSKGENERISHFCHYHPLQYSQDMEISTTQCKVCGDRCLKSSYFCKECNFYIHESCLNFLTPKIDNHYFNCTLVLLATSSYFCTACGRQISNAGLTFFSIERGFKLCTECVLWPKNKYNVSSFTSIHHWHQLSSVSDDSSRQASCSLCRGKDLTSMYYCELCRDYFHQTCAEQPFKMPHILHQQHPLTLISCLLLPKSNRSCSLCLGKLTIEDHPSGVYHCEKCGFQLDKKCVTSFPSIQYQDHPHLLTILENMHGEEVCRVCSNPCPRKSNLHSQKKENKSAFRCARCNFTIHLECGPLPCNIKHPCHVHPLLLEDFSVEENYNDKFACHICEDQRDPRLPVYRCPEGCPMICEITCAMSQIMPKLLGYHRDVELRTTYPNVASKVIYKDEALNAQTDVSTTIITRPIRFNLKDLYHKNHKVLPIRMGRIIGGQADLDLSSHDKKFDRDHEDESMFKFSKEALVHFSNKLSYTSLTNLEIDGLPDFVMQHDQAIIQEGEYSLPETLVPIYKEFSGKYKVHPNYGLATKFFSRRVDPKSYRSYLVFIVAAVLHNMHTTKMIDVTRKRVCEWLNLMMLVEKAGYISSVFDEIKLVWEAHFLIKAKTIVDDTSDKLQEEAKQLSRKRLELEEQLEEIKEKIEKNKKDQEDHKKYVGDGIKNLRKELEDVLLIKWKPATYVFNLSQ